MHPHEGNGSQEDRRLQIAVAGGSIGGLCAGLALHGSGFDVNVYERHPGPMNTRGAGIVVQGELVQLLDTYGAPPLPTTSCRVRRYLDPQGGDGQVQSMPRAFTSWEAIYETLRVAFPKERYHMGATLVGVNDPGKDAAFVVRPHTAGATAKAARDATVLATALKRARQNVDAGLRSFEDTQLEYGRDLVGYGVALGQRWASKQARKPQPY